MPEGVLATFDEARRQRQRELSEELATRSGRWFDLEMEKLDRWADDRSESLKGLLDEIGQRLQQKQESESLFVLRWSLS